MRDIGWDVDTLPASYTNISTLTLDAAVSAEALADDASLANVLDVIRKAGDVYRAIRNLGDAPPGIDAAAFLQEIGATRPFEYLLTRYLALELPQVYGMLRATGVVQDEVIEPPDGRDSYVRTHLRYAEIPKVLTQPHEIPARVYGWGTPDLDFDLIAAHLFEIFDALGLNVAVHRVDQDIANGFAVAPVDDTAKSIDLAVRLPFFEEEVAGRIMEVGLSIWSCPQKAVRLRAS